MALRQYRLPLAAGLLVLSAVCVQPEPGALEQPDLFELDYYPEASPAPAQRAATRTATASASVDLQPKAAPDRCHAPEELMSLRGASGHRSSVVSTAQRRCRNCANRTVLKLDAVGMSKDHPAKALRSADCPGLHIFNSSSGSACLAGRRVFVLGNSVARGYASSAGIAFGGQSAAISSRDVQKQMCPKSALHGNRATCGFAAGGWKIRFFWVEYLDLDVRSVPKPFKATGDDACFPTHRSSRACLLHILGDSRPGDVLLFNMGLHYLWFDWDRKRQLAWVKSSLGPFAESVAMAWHGRPEDVFRARLTPLRPPRAGRDSYNMLINSDVEEVNAAADAAFARMGWSSLDMHSVAAAHPELLVDHVHYAHNFYLIAWHLLLSSLCGDPAAWLRAT